MISRSFFVRHSMQFRERLEAALWHFACIALAINVFLSSFVVPCKICIKQRQKWTYSFEKKKGCWIPWPWEQWRRSKKEWWESGEWVWMMSFFQSFFRCKSIVWPGQVWKFKMAYETIMTHFDKFLNWTLDWLVLLKWPQLQKLHYNTGSLVFSY